MKPTRAKRSRGDLLKQIEKLGQDNKSLGLFCEGLIAMVKAVHAESAKEAERLRNKISPSAKKSRSVFYGICEQLGPYCLDVAEEMPNPQTASEKAAEKGVVPKLEIKKGDEDASHSETDKGSEPGSGSGDREDSGEREER